MLRPKRTASLLCLAASITLFTLIPLAIVFGQVQETPKTRGVRVTILLYSGRENPSYMLDDTSAIEQLKSQLAKATLNEGFDKTTVIPSVLGYAGIIVSNQKRIPGLPAQMEIYNKDIGVKNEGTKFLLDEGGAVETLLLKEALAKGAIDKRMLEYIRAGQIPAE